MPSEIKRRSHHIGRVEVAKLITIFITVAIVIVPVSGPVTITAPDSPPFLSRH